MSRTKRISCLLFFVLMLGANSMKAQTDNKPALSTQQQNIVTVAALIATGDLVNLSAQLNPALDGGLTIEEAKEIAVQLYAYCGFPRSLNAINTLMNVLEKRKADGISDKQGVSAVPKKAGKDKYEQGRKVLEELTQTPQPKPAPGFGIFAPRVDVFLKEHLFADIFESHVFTYQQREFITIAALTSTPGVTAQLRAHVKMGMNTGITEIELAAVADLIEKYVSRTQANTLREIIGVPVVPVMQSDMMIRISEIEVLPEFLEEYNAILREESAASVAKEPGVLGIFPMSIKEQANHIRIVEIYADKSAYQSHLKTTHFQHYKTTTLKMVKSLKLVDMSALDGEAMPQIFRKLR